MQDLNDKVTGGELTAPEWNQPATEIQNVIEALAITLSGSDLDQLGKAIAGYVANNNFYTDSGAANAYVLTQIGSKQAITAYTDGAQFDFIADNDNAAGSSTVNVAGLGVKSIVTRSGANPAAGEISGRVSLRYDLANDNCVLLNFVEPTDIESNMVRSGNTHLWDGSSGRSFFDIDLNITESAYESVGPTGSGADNIWTDMDNLPSEARILLVQVVLLSTTVSTAISTVELRFASNDIASPPTDTDSLEYSCRFSGLAVANYGGIYGTLMIPLDANQVFKTRFDTSNVGGRAYSLIYKGFITD